MHSDSAPISDSNFQEQGANESVEPGLNAGRESIRRGGDDFVEVVEDFEETPARRGFGRHREMLTISCFAIVMSFCLEIVGEERVALRGLPHHPLPHTCFLRSNFRISCPGCGLTRSFIHLADGDIAASLAQHRCGVLLAMAVLLQVPYRLWAMYGRNFDRRARVVPRFFGWLLVAALILNWLASLNGY